jgi:hypothetical protein
MLSIVTGLPGSSKSYLLSQKTVELVERNMRWYKATGKVRQVVSNLEMSKEFQDYANSEQVFYRLWEDPEELPGLLNCDVIWEEMGAHVDSRSWEQLPIQLRRWLQQHRHRGVEIYGNCQDFADIDVAVRRLTGQLLYLMKVMGSRDPSPTTKPPLFIWGVILKFYMDPRTYSEQTKFENSTFAGFYTISRKGVELYSMFNDIKPGKYPPLQHRTRTCPDCGYVKTIHI